jgi:hypothetical protein
MVAARMHRDDHAGSWLHVRDFAPLGAGRPRDGDAGDRECCWATYRGDLDHHHRKRAAGTHRLRRVVQDDHEGADDRQRRQNEPSESAAAARQGVEVIALTNHVAPVRPAPARDPASRMPQPRANAKGARTSGHSRSPTRGEVGRQARRVTLSHRRVCNGLNSRCDAALRRMKRRARSGLVHRNRGRPGRFNATVFFQAAAGTSASQLRLSPCRPSMPTDTGPSMVTRRTMRGWSP